MPKSAMLPVKLWCKCHLAMVLMKGWQHAFWWTSYKLQAVPKLSSVAEYCPSISA
jgi:hypothetical protein